jgi:hypothetical protein
MNRQETTQAGGVVLKSDHLFMVVDGHLVEDPHGVGSLVGKCARVNGQNGFSGVASSGSSLGGLSSMAVGGQDKRRVRRVNGLAWIRA